MCRKKKRYGWLGVDESSGRSSSSKLRFVGSKSNWCEEARGAVE